MKRLISLLLAGILIFSLVPAQVLATDGTADTAPSEEATEPTVMVVTEPVNQSEDEPDPSEETQPETTEATKPVRTVTFDSNGGSEVESKTVNDGEPVEAPTTTRENYIFGGWYHGDTQWDFETAVTEDIDLTAKWLEAVTVTFDTDGGSEVAPQTVAKGSTVKEPNEPTKGSRVFGGWFDNDEIKWDFEEDTVDVNTTLYAKWLIKVTFMDGDTKLGELGVANKGKVSESDVPAKKGFALAGLYKDAALTTLWDYEKDAVSETTTLYTKWDPVFTVTFNSNGGSKVDSQTLAPNGTATRPTDPTKDNFVFDDWYTDAERTTKFDFSTKVTKNTTLYANWKVKVTFESNKGSAVASQTLNIGDKVTKPTDPTRPTYLFGGWYKDISLNNPWNFDTDTVSKNAKLYAKWNATVSFESNGGSDVQSQTVAVGTKATKPTDPVKGDLQFGGWYKEAALTNAWDFGKDTVTTGNTKLYAKWNVTVSFVPNEGTPVPDQTVAENGKIATAPVSTKEGFVLEGWYKDEDLTEAWNFATDTFTENITLYANWEEAVTVIFNTGTGTDTVAVGIGKKVTKPDDPEKYDHEFAGWYKDEEYTDPWDFKTDTVTSETTLYAKWLELFTVTFNSNNGSKVSPVDVADGGTVTEPTAPTRNNYVFGGWYKEAALTNPWDFKTDIVEGDITLYAKWNHKVIFETNGGSAVAAQGVAKGGTVTEPNDPTKKDFVFGGWYADADLTDEWDFEKDTINGTTTLYAKWMVKVTFNSNGGSAVEPEYVILDVGDLVEEPDNPEKSNSVFKGWYNGSAAWDFEEDTVSKNITLTAKWETNPLKVSPTAKELYPGDTATFTAKYNTTDDVSTKVDWEVDGATDEDTDISSSGVLTIGEDEEAGTIRVIATYSGASDFAVITVKPTYEFKSGTGSKWAQKSTKSLTFECTGPYDELTKVTIGSTTVSSTNYTVEESTHGTKLVLKSAAMSSLAVGEHKLTLYYSDDGRAVTTFEVIKESDIPETGDALMLPLWLTLLAITAAAALMMKKRSL